MAQVNTSVIKNWLTVPMIIIAIMVTIGIFAPVISPYRTDDYGFSALLTPQVNHILGTNNLGQDIFSLLLAGFRTSIIIALSSAVLSTLIGTFMAAIATVYRGWLEKIIMRLTELLIMVPEIILILVFATFAGPGIQNIVVVIAIFSWARIARIIKARTDLAINSERVQYTIMMKGNLLNIIGKMWRDIYPSISTLFVLQCGKAIMYEAELALIGISDPSVMTWGRLIRQSIDFGVVYHGNAFLWWLLPPVICLVALIASISFIVFNREGKKK